MEYKVILWYMYIKQNAWIQLINIANSSNACHFLLPSNWSIGRFDQHFSLSPLLTCGTHNPVLFLLYRFYLQLRICLFCVWLVLLSTTPSRFIHVSIDDIIPFLLKVEQYSIMCTFHFFFILSTGWALGQLWYLAIVNNAK